MISLMKELTKIFLEKSSLCSDRKKNYYLIETEPFQQRHASLSLFIARKTTSTESSPRKIKFITFYQSEFYCFELFSLTNSKLLGLTTFEKWWRVLNFMVCQLFMKVTLTWWCRCSRSITNRFRFRNKKGLSKGKLPPLIYKVLLTWGNL